MHFKEVPMITVAKRLGEICENEGLETDLGTLRMLAETADGDLRSCINTLQV
jgi:chromosome transmission fidelity protein 18